MPSMLTDQERLRIWQRIAQVSLELSSAPSLEALLQQIVRAAAELTGSGSARMLLADDAATLRPAAATGDTSRWADLLTSIDDTPAGVAFREGRANVGERSLAVPLLFKEHKIGVLEVEGKGGARQYGEADSETLALLAAQSTISIRNARMLERLRQGRGAEGPGDDEEGWAAEQRERKLARLLRQASAWLNSTLDSHEVIDRILAHIAQIIPNDACNLMLIREDNIAHVFRGRGYERFGTAQSLDVIQLDVMKVAGLRKMVEERAPLLIPDVTLDANWVYSRPEHTWIRSYIGAPVFAHERVLGFLTVLSARPNAFSQEDAVYLHEFSRPAAIAITNAQLHQQAQQELAERIRVEGELRLHRDNLEELVAERTAALALALAEAESLNRQLQIEIKARQQAEERLRTLSVTDPLTGASNRRHLWLLGEQALKQARRYGHEIVALMLDADHFKQINDTHGHTVGDAVLKVLVEHLRGCLRAADILARYGGEEFVILMPYTSLATGLSVAGRLLEGVRALSVQTPAGPLSFTVSIGVAAWQPGDDESLDALISRADRAMYAAKQTGRDRAVACGGVPGCAIL